MPVTPTFPGLYIQEVSSGVRTITGVSTSVTAFIGTARRGPINRARRVLSFADFERLYGGLDQDSDLGYAVRHFFVNGGAQAWVVRLAANVGRASYQLKNQADTDVLDITARDEGLAGNGIVVEVDYPTTNPINGFNLTLRYEPPDNPADNIIERFENLSMDSRSPRYVETMINQDSRLVIVQRLYDDFDALGWGTSQSGALVQADGSTPLDLPTLYDDAHNQLRIVVDGLPPVTVTLVAGHFESLASLATQIQSQVSSVRPRFQCQPNSVDNTLLLTSGASGEHSSVRVLPGGPNDISRRLRLGALNGGTEIDAVAAIRPALLPSAGGLISATITALPTETTGDFHISINGQSPQPIALDEASTTLPQIAARIELVVRALHPADPAYRDFTCTVGGTDQLVLRSGTRGSGSSVRVSEGDTHDIAGVLGLLGTDTDGATQIAGRDAPHLEDGSEADINDTNLYATYSGSRSARTGLYALEDVDIFNLLCLPGISDPGVLADAAAFCTERRAFLIVDAPAPTASRDFERANDVDIMESAARSADLPKSNYAAVYYPWIEITDPLNGGQMRRCPPSGAVAGIFARTDASRGVWKAPAGTDSTIAGALGVTTLLTDGENGVLNPLGVNCIRAFPTYGIVVWGARTLRGADEMTDEYKYIPIRRTALFIEESLYRGLKWVVFEPNDEPLWSQIRLNVGAFMQNLFRQGAFAGRSPRDAYLVKCDRETTTQNDINLGIVNIFVGFAPLKPAEFVIVKIQQLAGQLAV